MPLLYLKAAIIGAGMGLLADLLWVFATLWFPPNVEGATGAAGIRTPDVGSASSLLVALVGFVIGFYWTIRSARKERAGPDTRGS